MKEWFWSFAVLPIRVGSKNNAGGVKWIWWKPFHTRPVKVWVEEDLWPNEGTRWTRVYDSWTHYKLPCGWSGFRRECWSYEHVETTWLDEVPADLKWRY